MTYFSHVEICLKLTSSMRYNMCSNIMASPWPIPQPEWLLEIHDPHRQPPPPPAWFITAQAERERKLTVQAKLEADQRATVRQEAELIRASVAAAEARLIERAKRVEALAKWRTKHKLPPCGEQLKVLEYRCSHHKKCGGCHGSACTITHFATCGECKELYKCSTCAPAPWVYFCNTCSSRRKAIGRRLHCVKCGRRCQSKVLYVEGQALCRKCG